MIWLLSGFCESHLCVNTKCFKTVGRLQEREAVRSPETQADLGSEVSQTQEAELHLPPAAQTVIVMVACEHGH